LHINSRAIFATALYQFDSGMATMNPVNLTNYRSLLGAVLTTMATLPAAFVTHFNNQAVAAGLIATPTTPITPGTYTLAQCWTLDMLMHNWLTARHVETLVASNQNWWLGITNGG
jgi:hypothetical protein